ncbi:bifunctional proline dehydrogenase/L-glutamate gamma-semialdehyde dehydrogenase PutA [Simiduia sp. 21SJ11W-1]|uniref:bifunctional proline dehydrogenase/L-glutamate gamma-semialdehyde dehydrogenase PutA n=1 Tax=Simiduia sp. 21SJ11W-1 TaxID=2909669 RepID=UPI0020A10A38|nr:bifunctional proline dehydrogenase/L-glutamate gamma-semialdehyde dehydrogenase PutA [Simiduia sp. 21SJ11W-1]UTA49027.1 bifunctional proline dehydrogenase/L-glutamate gamma-semialdehyde dehydrogenase PutA [Simiduia sp. 21SJ11W-1]
MNHTLEALRDKARLYTYADEDQCVRELLSQANLPAQTREGILRFGRELVLESRNHRNKRGTLDAFLEEFGLSNREGIALMCLAEALLRIPDGETADKLIAEKVASGNWKDHMGQSDSLFVNASTWGLMLTGKVIRLGNEITGQTTNWFKDLAGRMGEPMIRTAMLQAMKIMGSQYVLGRTIKEGMNRGAGQPAATRFSFDMLGEGARNQQDADRYFADYQKAIAAIAKHNKANNVIDADGISIKISALHARYQYSQSERVFEELLPRIKQLAAQAKDANMGFNIDAEEAERLDLSLDIFAALARDPDLANWDGLGFVLQAYQKRAPHIARWLIELARETQRNFMVRLVKGAYWDTEIKHAQELGLRDYPVYTRKANSDLSYQICARILLDAPDAIFPQFATHNAHTVATIVHLVKPGQPYEFQRLHGMGQLMFEQVQAAHPGTAVRVYAPIGAHKDLLPYLVRRLLENGANSSFVNRFMDDDTPAEWLVPDIALKVASFNPYRHPAIAVPADLFAQSEMPRPNAPGFNLEHIEHSNWLLEKTNLLVEKQYEAAPIVNGEQLEGEARKLRSPANPNIVVGEVIDADAKVVDAALSAACSAQPKWNSLGGEHRALILNMVGELIEANYAELISLISREAGRTLNDGISEVREAIDFCHYYAASARQHFSTPSSLTGPTGEVNELSLHGRGVFVCISPWNFPLAIFVGQVAAALVAGNAVIAKPAEQTPLVAAFTVALMHQAGVPKDVLHLLIGDGAAIGKHLLSDSRIGGVAFTGSTETARIINLQLAQKPGPIVPFIAETGGLNAMIACSSALPEQLVDDVITSAFLSAGQRCSALRVLFLQQDIADRTLELLTGACDELRLGNPWELSTDMGPVIDEDALKLLTDHMARMEKEAKVLYRYPADKVPAEGSFFGPHIVELKELAQLEREVFGPVLHVIRYKTGELDKVLAQINNSGYGLTLGLHSRVEATAKKVFSQARVGNTYINRNMVGAVVGVNPFGGQGLSGTGPKAGGPLYVRRFATERTYTNNVSATGGNIALFSVAGSDEPPLPVRQL